MNANPNRQRNHEQVSLQPLRKDDEARRHKSLAHVALYDHRTDGSPLPNRMRTTAFKESLTRKVKHEHTCSKCGHVWVCMDAKWAICHFSKCGVTKVVKGNNGGPFCLLCFHLGHAAAQAHLRGMSLTEAVVQWLAS